MADEITQTQVEACRKFSEDPSPLTFTVLSKMIDSKMINSAFFQNWISQNKVEIHTVAAMFEWEARMNVELHWRWLHGLSVQELLERGNTWREIHDIEDRRLQRSPPRGEAASGASQSDQVAGG